jgi:hypothetical protein
MISCGLLDSEINIRVIRRISLSIALVESCNVWDVFVWFAKIKTRPTNR